MQDFRERTDLGNGLSWSAEFKGHDWARHFNFYFIVIIYREDAILRQFRVEVDDYKFGDSTCEYSREEIYQKVRQDLHRLAQNGETNTSALF
jgi:hypothetical protein